jgi:hypothetical protein
MADNVSFPDDISTLWGSPGDNVLTPPPLVTANGERPPGLAGDDVGETLTALRDEVSALREELAVLRAAVQFQRARARKSRSRSYTR